MLARAGSLLHQELRRVENRISAKQTLSHAVPTTSDLRYVLDKRLRGKGREQLPALSE